MTETMACSKLAANALMGQTMHWWDNTNDTGADVADVND